MSAELDLLTEQVTRTTEVQASAIVLINGLAAQLLAIKDDPAAIVALAERLQNSATGLADAVTANTPVA